MTCKKVPWLDLNQGLCASWWYLSWTPTSNRSVYGIHKIVENFYLRSFKKGKVKSIPMSNNVKMSTNSNQMWFNRLSIFLQNSERQVFISNYQCELPSLSQAAP